MESGSDGRNPLSSKTLAERTDVLPGPTTVTGTARAAKSAELDFKESAAVASRRGQANLQIQVAQNEDEVATDINRLAKHDQPPMSKADRVSLVSPAQATTNPTSSPLLSKDLQADFAKTGSALKELQAPPNAAVAPSPGLAIRQTLPKSSKEVSLSPPIEVLQKSSVGKAQQSTKEVQVDFLASVAAGRISEMLADSKKALPKEFFSEMQSIEVRAPEPLSAFMPGARWKEQPQVRSIFGREASETVQGPQSSSLSVATTSTTAAMSLQSPTDVYVAEQVSYWISRDVQNAEMKLEGLGSDPVQVNISMSGNEAHVVFRTDELQVRNALESASAHLREMLQQEGVTLSGVSVGSSGAGESGNQEENQRHGVKQMSVLAAQALQPAQRRDPSQVAGRSLDLFV